MNDVPQVMRERERYLTRTGKYEESAKLGYQVLEKLPNDPEAPVYLAYDLLYLNRYDEAYNMAVKYEHSLPKDKDLQLIKGYVHAHRGVSAGGRSRFYSGLGACSECSNHLHESRLCEKRFAGGQGSDKRF